MEEALRRGWENLIGRSDGPMTFRLIIQPAMAILFAIRAALHDVREGQPPFLRAVFSNPGHWREWLRQARNDVGKVFILALVLDAIYQVVVHSGIYALELLLTATILALLPYVIVRDLVTRIARRQWVARRADQRPGNQATLGEHSQQERQEG